MKYRKRPIEIEAVRLNGAGRLEGDMPDWIVQPALRGEIQYTHTQEAGLHVKTLEGVMRAGPGDWLIRGVQGEIYPCKDEVFRETYEPVYEANAA